MDEETPIDTSITVSSNPEDNIDDVLSSVDDQYWTPETTDTKRQITVTVTEEEEPITDIIVDGEFEKFVVTVLDKDDKQVVKDQVSITYFCSQAFSLSLLFREIIPFYRR